jgi:L-asparaginase
MRSTQIQLLITGGTLDKDYDEEKAALVFRQSQVDEMLRRGRCLVDIETEVLMMVDSLEITAAQRERIVEDCLGCARNHIVITHGTDTMVETAKAIAEVVQGKTIVITGAMVPYAFGSVDGLFNLGGAIAFVQTLPPGVYIVMNGRSFTWNNVRKNRDSGLFEPLSP